MDEAQDTSLDTIKSDHLGQELIGCAWQVQDHDANWRPCRVLPAYRQPDEFQLRNGITFAPMPPLYLCSRHWTGLGEWGRQYGTRLGMLVGEQRLIEEEAKEIKHQIGLMRRELGRLKQRRMKIRREVLERASGPIEIVGSTVYVLRRERDGLIKIGYTTNLFGRLGTHWQEQGPVVVLALIDGDRLTEFLLHAQFRSHLAEGREWFHPHPDVLAWIDSLEAADEAS